MSTTREEVVPDNLLKLLAERGSLDSYQYSQESGCEHQAVVGAIKSLESLGDVSGKCQVLHGATPAGLSLLP